MANKPIAMSKVRQILKLYSKGIGKKKIAERLGVSKRTVKHYIDFYVTLKTPWKELENLEDLELNNIFHPPQSQPPTERLQQLYAFFPDVAIALRRRGMTRALQYKAYRSKHPDGYESTQFYHHFHLWSKKHKPSMPITHKAGDKFYLDFAGGKLPYVDELTGEILQAEVFVSILGWSQYSYVEPTVSQEIEELIPACENALHYFKGVPLAAVPDNMKTAVNKARRYEPELNANFLAFADHYGVAIVPARVRKPKDKAHVENLVKITYQRIFACLPEGALLTFTELKEHVQKHLRIHNDTVLTGKECSRTDQWLLEQPLLQPLPEKRYEMRKIKQCTVHKNGHVFLTEDKHYYSVPYELIGKQVIVHYSRSRVEIYLNYELIACHERVRSRGQYSTLQSHRPPQHQFVTEWSPEFFIGKARQIDPIVEYYITQVFQRKQYPEQAYKSCQGILSFEKRVGSARLIKACQRAHEFGYYNYKIIEDILKKNLDQFDEAPAMQSMPAHENIRGADYYQ